MRTACQGLCIVLCLLTATPVFGTSHGYGTIISTPEAERPLTLADRWNRSPAVRPQAQGGGWTGYCIDIPMEPENWIGMKSSGKPSLREAIADAGVSVISGGQESVNGHTDGNVRKTIAILIYRPDGTSGASGITEVRLCDIDLYTDLDDKTLVWLGGAGMEESVVLLTEAYREVTSFDAKRDIVAAIGIHRGSPKVLPFLENIITVEIDDEVRSAAVFWLAQQDHPDTVPMLGGIIENDHSPAVRKQAIFALSLIKTDDAREILFDAARNSGEPELRKQAIFWLAEADTPDVLSYLLDIINTDPSIEVRRDAVFSLSRMKTPGAEDALIEAARRADNPEVQKQAIFWLGQHASQKIVEVLSDITYDASTTEIQRQAVFALSQSSQRDSIPLLIGIAQEHPNTEVRKQAVFWLGQSGDEQALDALVNIIRN